MMLLFKKAQKSAADVVPSHPALLPVWMMLWRVLVDIVAYAGFS
jgi:hypothetical protein